MTVPRALALHRHAAMLHAALLLPFALVSLQQPDTVIPSAIRSVDVYPSTALVTRVGELPAGDTRVVVRGLPGSLVAASLRLRAPGSEIVALESRERWERSVPDASIREAQARLDEVRAAIAGVRDEVGVLDVLSRHFTTLMDESAKGEAALGLTTEQRLATVAMVREQLGSLAEERRTLGRESAELEVERQRLEQNLARWQQGESTKFVDVVVDLLDTDGSADPFELEYQVNGASWEPFYDLRASGDLSSVEIVHRARVHQQTGEDWNGVDLALSTVSPQRGLAAPEPRIQWLDLWNRAPSGGVLSMAPAETAVDRREALKDLEFDMDTLSANAKRAASGHWAEIEADGVNLRYALPRPQVVASRPEPTSVLVGREKLEVAMERVCMPGISPTVWLRGHATNTTPWVLLEGEATVYVGSNFLGTTSIARVQTGAEFDLPFGEDPNVTVERIQTENTEEQPGIFGSKVKSFETFKINVTNTSTQSVRLIMQESLPRARDERIEVAIERVAPPLATDERWKTDREEKGVVAWALDLAAGAKRTVELRLSYAYPQKSTLTRQ